ncbi:MAG: DUF1761 domain-containing protein [Terracidiphilus sp.]|jgi:hypothetical protein
MHHLHFNHLAVLVSALFLWFLGAAWYSPTLFAKPWMALIGLKMGESKRKSLIFGMVTSLLGDLLVSFALAHVVLWSGATTFAWGALIGFICWLGFIAAPNFPQGIYERRPFKLFAINAGYWLIGLIAVGGLLAVWH